MKRALIIAAFLAIAAMGIAVAWSLWDPGVQVTIVNVGAKPLRSVVVHVTGNSYPVGDIEPGASKTVAVHAKGESSIELEHDGGKRLDVDCYFEKGYGGKITAEVTGEKVVSVKSDVR